MEFHNHTPFAPLTFESLDAQDEAFQVVILRGTFRIIPNARLRPLPEQEPVRTTDEFFGDLLASSVRFESDLVPYKPRTDIVINTVAYAPKGKAATSWLVGAQIGRQYKQLLVTGACEWRHHFVGGWKISQAEPCTEIQIRYEHAYGGQWQHEEKAGVFEENPTGVGYADNKHLDKSIPLPAPRLMSPSDPVVDFHRRYKPEGFSAIHKAWLPRRSFAGTFDEQWRNERHPKLPHDFDYAYYNCAHPDLIYQGFLRGDEAIALKHLHRQYETLAFSLPAYRIGAVVTDKDGYRYGAIGNLDTVHVEVEQMRVYLVWRLTLPLFQHGIKLLETKMEERGFAMPVRLNKAGVALSR